MPTSDLRLVSLLLCTRGAASLCLGTAKEPKSCRRVREYYTAAPVPPSALGLNNMRDVDAFLSRLGLPTGLPLLDVAFDDGRVPLRGGGAPRNNSADVFLGRAPLVSWDANRIKEATVAFIDPDCGGRRLDPSEPGWCGPVLHSLWHDCTAGNLQGCRTSVPYNPPGVSKARTNRYVWLLLAQPSPLAADSLPAQPKSVASWDCARWAKPLMHSCRLWHAYSCDWTVICVRLCCLHAQCSAL